MIKDARQFIGLLVALALISILPLCTQPEQSPNGLLLKANKPAEIGVWVSGYYYQSPQFKNNVLDTLRVNNTLVEIRSTDTMPAKYFPISYYIKNGKGVQLNYLYNRRGDTPVSFIGTRAERNNYRDSLETVLTMYHPIVLCVEREEGNADYYYGPVKLYKKELKKAKGVCKDFGVKLSNGGVTTRNICLLTYRWYQDKGDTAAASSFGKRCLPDQDVKDLISRKNKRLEDKLLRQDSFMTAYEKYCDWVNVHWYEPVKARGEAYNPATDTVSQATPNALIEVVAYIKARTGKKTMTNEMGQINSSPALTLSMLIAAKDAGLQYIGWFSGDLGRGNATSLYTPSGFLTPTGEEFRRFLSQ